jgi:WD40 repeat protein
MEPRYRFDRRKHISSAFEGLRDRIGPARYVSRFPRTFSQDILHSHLFLVVGLIHCLDWSPEYLAVASNKHCAIYDTKSFKLLHETSRRLTTIQALKFNIDGSYLAMGEREVIILEGKPPFRIHCEISNTPNDSKVSQFRYRITSLCWSSSGSFLAIAGSDGACLVVETKGFALVHQIQRTESINALSWEQQYLAVSDDSCTVALIKAGTELAASSQMDDYSSAASSTNFTSAASADWVLRDDAFRDVEDVAPSRLPRDVKSQSNITAVAFSRRRTSSYLAYAADDCSLSILTTRDWKVVFQSKSIHPLETSHNRITHNRCTRCFHQSRVCKTHKNSGIFTL